MLLSLSLEGSGWECIDLSLEKISRGPNGFTITHTRSKQRSDKLSTKFMIPQAGGVADMLAIYLDKVKDQLEKYEGTLVGKLPAL